MLLVLARNWWALALRGCIAILFGIAAVVWPDLTLRALVILFGAFVLVDGIFTIIGAAMSADRSSRWWMLLAEGLLSIVVGVLTFVWPDITALVLLVFIASWAIVTGVFEIMAAIRLRREIEDEWLMGLSGAASLIFGALLLIRPDAGALAVTWLIGIYALIFGALLLALAFRLRNLQERLERQSRRGVSHPV